MTARIPLDYGLERMRHNCGALPTKATADNGYQSEANMAYCEAQGVDAYLAIRKSENLGALGQLPMTRAQEARWRMHQKPTTPEGRAICRSPPSPASLRGTNTRR